MAVVWVVGEGMLVRMCVGDDLGCIVVAFDNCMESLIEFAFN